MKWNQKQIVGLVAMVLVAAFAIGGIALWMRENRLEQIQNEALAELERNAGQYDEQSIVLYQTSKAKAEELAKLYGAALRITENGRFATLTLPEGTTIRDVYAMDESCKYIDEMAADYHVQVSELTEEETDGERLPQRPQYIVSDTDYELQTYLDYLNMGEVWNNHTGSGVTVAVIDTGIDTDHPEFAGRISEYSYNATEDKIVKDYDDWSLIEDEVGHGTAVTGVIAASMDDSGIVGIAPNVEIIVIKAECDENGTFKRTSDLVFGLYYAIERDVQVVNMSFGTYSIENPFAEATQLAYDSDIICVAAAGNGSTSSLCWPAADPYVIGVGALDGWELADYSNYGENVDMCAPGTTYTTLVGGKYGLETGTSLASPVVAGAMALLLQNNPYTTFVDVTEVLYASCYDLGDLGRDWYYGFGALDVSALILEERGKITYEMLTDELENLEGLFIQGHTLQELPEPERLYAVFDGWYYDDTFTQEYNYYTDKFYGEVTLYAKWVNEDDGIPYTYVILDDGTVEIRSYTGHRRYITIPEKIEGRVVSSIGDFAFDGQTRLREVTLPSGLTHIGLYAFQNCANLVSIQIPENVTEIEEGAFGGNVRLSTVAFLGNSKLHTIGDFAFSKCSRLEQIELPVSLQSINGSAFYGATSLYHIGVQQGNTAFKSVDGVLYNLSGSTLVAFPAAWGNSYTLPEGTAYIGDYAFALAKVKKIDLANVISIGENGFLGAALETLVIPDSVTKLGARVFGYNFSLSNVQLGRGLAEISSDAFLYCERLKHITIPNGIVSISGGAFSDSGLESVTFEENSTLEVIGVQAFFNCNIHEIDIPASVLTIGVEAFSGQYVGNPLVRVSFAENALLQTIGGSAFKSCQLLQNIELPGSLHTIGESAFMNSGLTEVTIPAGVEYLGAGAFACCSDLTDIHVEAGNAVYHDINGIVHNLDNTEIHAFPAGKDLKEYIVEATVRTVMPWAFAGAKMLDYVILPEGLTVVGEYAMYLSGISTASLPETLEEIHEWAFAKCKNLTSLQIPDNVMQIGRYAFAYDEELRTVSFNETSRLPRLSYATFAYSGLYVFEIPASISTMSQNVFMGCQNLHSITFAANSKLESISAYVFNGCTNLTSITFAPGSNLTSIQAHGLEGMAKLSYIDFGDAKLTNIDNFAFRFCESLCELNIPETVTNIGRYAFYGCKNLSSLTVPENVEHIGGYAFLGTNDIEVYFQSENLPTYLDENWDYDTKGYYTGVSSVEENGDYRYAVLPSGNVAILEYLGSDTAIDLTQVNLGGNISIIGGSAFKDSTVQSIILPDTLTAIQAEAFAYSALQNVTIPPNVTFIGREAFAYTDIASVTFGENAKINVIEQYAFEGTENLTSVVLSASLTKMGTGVFLNSGLQSVMFEQGIQLEEIPQKAFAETKLTAVTLPDSVTLVNHNAFNNVQTLKSVTFGNNDGIRLMSNAFYHTGLETLHIPANVTFIGEYCFVALGNLTEFTVDENNPNYKAEDGLLLSKSGRKLIAVPAGRTGSLTVPLSVEEIGFGAFEGSQLSEILFHEDANILALGYRAFFKANNITTITVPKSVVSIDYYAFAYCENLREVIFVEGNQLKGIYEGAFCGDINLETIIIPDTIVEISDFAFYGCKKITELPVSTNNQLKGIYDYAFAYAGLSGEFTAPENLIDIGDYAFLGCNFEKATIPDTNKKNLIIGIGAFEDCNYLTEITLPFIGASYEDEQITWFGYIFGAGSYRANETYVPESLKTVTLTEGVTTLGWGAFAYCSNLETINVPHSVSLLYPDTFRATTARYTLTNTISVYVDGEMFVSIGEGQCAPGFYGHLTLAEGISLISIHECPNLTGITIPDGVKTVWMSYNGVTELVCPDSVTDILCDHCPNLQSVQLPSKGEELEFYFGNCARLTSVVLPEGLKQIGPSAFYQCKSLQNVQIPDSVTYIDDSAFLGCSELRSITLPENLTYIGHDAFSGCYNLLEIVNKSNLQLSFGSWDHGFVAAYARWIVDKDGNKTYQEEGDNAIYVETQDGYRFLLEDGKYSLVAYIGNEQTLTLPKDIQGHEYEIRYFRCGKHIVLPEGMTTIEDCAFEGNKQLEGIVIPDSVTTIGMEAFADCSALESIVIPDSVTQIGLRAFERCTALKTVKLSAGLTEIGYALFADCTSLETVEIPSCVTIIGSYAFTGCKALDSVTLPDSLEYIGYEAFANTAFTYLRIPAGLRTMESGAFQGSSLETLEIDPENLYFAQVDNILYNREMTKIYYVPCGITHVEIPASVVQLDSAFAHCTELKTVSFEEGSALREIGYMAFAGCTSLETIDWPENLERIENNAFYDCTALKDIQLPETLQYLGYEAFMECTALTEITIPASVTDFQADSFWNCTSLQAINVDPDNSAYSSYDGIVYAKDLSQIVAIPAGLQGSITIPEGVTEIGFGIFGSCAGITEITLPQSLTDIPAYAFYNCVGLRKIHIPDTVTTIGVYAFSGCESLEEINIPTGISVIETGVFDGCESLARVVIPDTVTRIGSYAFADCTKLVTVELPQSLTEIEYGTFSWCANLLYVDIPEGVVSIGDNAFYECYQMRKVTLPESLQEIGNDAFYFCHSLYEIHNYSSLPLTCGSMEYGYVAEYANIIVDKDGNSTTLDPNTIYAVHVTEDGLVFVQENDTYILVAYVGDEDTVTLPLTFQGSGYDMVGVVGIRHVILPEGFTQIPMHAFSGNLQLESIVIPDTVTEIGLGAFEYCSNLTSIELPDSVTYIGPMAFRYCENLEEVILGESVVEIGERALEGTAFAADSSNWKDNCLYMGRYLMDVDENCTHITVAEDTLSVASDAFANCDRLKVLETPICNREVLRYCVNLETLILTRNQDQFLHTIPMTLKNIVLTETFEWDPDNDSLFAYVSDVVIFVEADENALRWDDNYPGWNADNDVIYGEDWILVNFYDSEGNLIQSAPQRTSAIVRLPYVKTEEGYALVGWDLDGDGVADSVPATSTVDINAYALVKRVCDHNIVIDEAVAPTCTESGMTEGKHCDICGDVLVAQEEIAATGHSHEEAVIEPSCTEDGSKTYTCHCGDTYMEIIPAFGHDYSSVVTAPTCAEAGHITHTCANCGDTYTEVLPKEPHSFVDGECENCGAPEVEPGDVNGDGKVNARDARLILRYLAGLEELDETSKAAADVNGDGRVTARDARAILRAIAGLD